MENLKFNHSLDWITATWTHRDFPEQILPQVSVFDIGEETKAGGYYKNAYKLACGGIYAYSDSVRQGIMVMLPGQALGTMRQSGWSDEMTINWLMTAHNVSRMDFAVDIFGGTAKDHSPHDFYNAHQSGQLKSRMRLDRSYIDHSKAQPGETYYWGSKTSDQRVCVYNKGVQMNMLKYAWTRVELRLKDDYAKGLRNDMQDYGVSKAGVAKLKQVFDADIEYYQQALEHDPIFLSEVPRKEPNFPGWLQKVIKPAFEKNMSQNRDSIVEFYHWLGALLNVADPANLWKD